LQSTVSAVFWAVALGRLTLAGRLAFEEVWPVLIRYRIRSPKRVSLVLRRIVEALVWVELLTLAAKSVFEGVWPLPSRCSNLTLKVALLVGWGVEEAGDQFSGRWPFSGAVWMPATHWPALIRTYRVRLSARGFGLSFQLAYLVRHHCSNQIRGRPSRRVLVVVVVSPKKPRQILGGLALSI
jgi:hypothetical protein